MLIQAYRFALDPTAEQEEGLRSHCGGIREAPLVVYWGDMDKDGYEILNGYRADFGRDIDSVLMDPATYEEYEEFGTDFDKNGKPLEPGSPKPVDGLHADEQVVYLRVLDAAHTGRRRVEQERIPLSRALAAVELVVQERSASRGQPASE